MRGSFLQFPCKLSFLSNFALDLRPLWFHLFRYPLGNQKEGDLPLASSHVERLIDNKTYQNKDLNNFHKFSFAPSQYKLYVGIYIYML